MDSANRVDPWGRRFDSAERGYFMGNRDSSKAWITCSLRDPDGAAVIEPVTYDKLFFLDEATALAAGHRPCWRCRRTDYGVFLRLFGADDKGEMDAALDRERAERDAGQYQTAIAEKLPPGAMFAVEKDCYLAWQRLAFLWSPSGYTPAGLLERFKRARVLTLPSTLKALEAGYRPWVHPSVLRA
jgi:hypothetical protein